MFEINTSFKLIEDDLNLLQSMCAHFETVDYIYKPGPYWKNSTINATRELKKFGLNGFRGWQNGAATSFGDNAIVDYRSISNFGIRNIINLLLRKIYPFNKIFDNQVGLTKDYFTELVKYRTLYLNNLIRVNFLLKHHNITFDTLKGDCVTFGDFNGKLISHHYLQVLDTLDHVNEHVNFKSKKSFLEIGGGFGANVHLLIELFPNIKKIIYLDIPPNLYVGTQYLKSFYGDSVLDFNKTKSYTSIQFRDDDSLEIFCLTPDKIELINSEVDIFHNAHSFVEMNSETVKNYALHVERILNKSAGVISLVSYDGFDDLTLNPNSLVNFFTNKFSKDEIPTLTPNRFNYHFYSQ